MGFLTAFTALILHVQPIYASDLDQAPPSFTYQGNKVVPIDLKEVDLDLKFDYQKRTTTGVATLKFVTGESGWPMLDLVPNARQITLNGQAVSTEKFPAIPDPDRVTSVRVLKQQVPAGVEQTLVISYRLNAYDITYSNGAVRAGFFMSDLATGGREFLEQFAPANLEFDQATYRFQVSVNGTSKPHRVFSNGNQIKTSTNQWSIEFPSYFTSSSLYFHMAEEGRFQVEEFEYRGAEKTIPFTVYSQSPSLVSQAVRESRRVMGELESTYGPYMHDQVLIYVTSNGGGMEYGGATITSMFALGHEMTHFWFARGVMPRDGNSGWIDEAIASWRDDGYIRANSGPNRSPVNLGGFSPYRRHTSMQSYSLGERLMREFDYLFRNIGGLKPMLKEFYRRFQGKTITQEAFKNFLEDQSSKDLGYYFNRYVMGRSSDEGSSSDFQKVHPRTIKNERTVGNHPRPFTREERQALR